MITLHEFKIGLLKAHETMFKVQRFKHYVTFYLTYARAMSKISDNRDIHAPVVFVVTKFRRSVFKQRC